LRDVHPHSHTHPTHTHTHTLSLQQFSLTLIDTCARWQ